MLSRTLVRRIVATGFAASLLIAAAAVFAQQDPAEMMPSAQEEHLWLKRFVGEWEMQAEFQMEPGAEPMTSTGTETVHAIGDFWVVSHLDSTMMDAPFKGVLTIGFDPKQEKYIGTWIDSFNSHMWRYEGTVNEAGTTLTLEAEGPVPGMGENVKFRETTEFKSERHRVFTSSMQMPDGEWTTILTVNYHKKQ